MTKKKRIEILTTKIEELLDQCKECAESDPFKSLSLFKAAQHLALLVKEYTAQTPINIGEPDVVKGDYGECFGRYKFDEMTVVQ